MDPENFKQAWKSQSSQSRLKIDTELLLVPMVLVVKRNQSAESAITSELTERAAVSVPRLYAVLSVSLFS